jgi:predicted alpha/beta hydrolase family esterase
MIQGLKEKGYSTGFSMGGLPYDFRKFHLTNEQFQEKFEILVEMLYRNTGKKVIVVAHSLGNLNVLRILNKENPINSKIKRYIGMVPPFFGAAKAVEFFSSGSKEFRMKLFLSEYIDISSQAQKFYSPFTPASYALMFKPKLHDLARSEHYSEFIEALKERFDLEKKCGVLSKDSEKQCNHSFIREMSKNFKKFFGFFPQFDSEVCLSLRERIKNELQNEQFLIFKNKTRADIFENLPSYEGCEIRIFDFLRCPFIKIISGNSSLDQRNFTLDDFQSTCFEDIESTDIPDLIFNHDCKFKKNAKNCLLDFLKNYTIFDVKSFFAQKDPSLKDFPDSLFINQSDYQRTLELMTDQTSSLDSLSELNPPKVATSIVYASYLDTKTNYIFSPDKANATLTKDDINYFGGDGTVATYSSLIPAMKWIYDNKKNSNFF